MIRMNCERCRRRMRHVLTVPDIGSWVEDWYFDPRTGRTVRVAEIDEDVCERCGEEIIAACEAHEAAQAMVA